MDVFGRDSCPVLDEVNTRVFHDFSAKGQSHTSGRTMAWSGT